jgi:hypothetical protein
MNGVSLIPSVNIVETGDGAENLRDIRTYVYMYVLIIPSDEGGATLQLKTYLTLHRLAIT